MYRAKGNCNLSRWSLPAATLVLIVAWLASPASALAHPKLVKSSPEAGSIVDTAPAGIELEFTEAVSLEFSTVQVFDRARREQAMGALGRVGGQDTTLSVPFSGQLPPGVYTVIWRVLSVVDGHLIAGNFAFRVRGGDEGTPTTDGTPEPVEPIAPIEGEAGSPFEGTAAGPDPLRWVVRAVILATSILLAGGPIFTVLITEPTVARGDDRRKTLGDAAGHLFAQVGAVAAFLLLVALVLDLMFQVASVASTDLLGALGRGDLALPLINTTRYGFSWALKTIAGVLLIGFMLFAWLRRNRAMPGLWELTIAGGSLLLLAQSLGSHAAAVAAANTVAGIPLPVINDWLHLVTVATWVGGVGYMALALFPAFRAARLSAQEWRGFLADAIPQFSRLAIASVIVLAITGTYNLLIHSTDLSAILGSQYGQVLALKVGLFVALVAIGAINLRRLSPMLRARLAPGPQEDGQAAETAPARRLGRNIRLEVALGVLALLCAGGLTLLPPPSGAGIAAMAPAISERTSTPRATEVAEAEPPTPIPTPQPATAGTEVAGYNFSLTTRPSIEGDELTLLVERVSEASPPLTDVAKVLIKVTPQDVDAGSTSYQATSEGAFDPDRQVWKITEPILTLDGGYLITTIVQRTESPDVKAAFRLDLSVDYGLKASPAQVMDVRIATNPSPPISGTSTLTVTLVDGSRAPIEGAQVSVNPFMPAHAHIEPTSVAVPVPNQPGSYATKVEFDMGGAWLFIFNVERDGAPPTKADASLQVIGPTATADIAPRTPRTTAAPLVTPQRTVTPVQTPGVSP